MPDGMQITLVPVKDLRIDSSVNVRRTKLNEDIDELADSSAAVGLIQPVVLLGTPGNPPYKIMVGQRRYLAHKKLGYKNIQAIFENGLSKFDILARSLAENMLRQDLNHADAADVVTNLYKHFGGDLKAETKVKKATGLSLQRVRDYIKVSERASPAMKRKLKDKKVKLADVKRALHAANGNIDKADRLLDLMEKFVMTTHQKRRLAEYGAQNPSASDETIVKEARKPKIEQTLLVNLSDAVKAALTRATNELSMAPEEVAIKALSEWLANQGFVK